ncbi:MAG: hypothetical protein ACRDIZ_13695 [Actinomycetota bacterium]
MRARQARRVLRIDGLIDLGLAASLLLAPWASLYDALGLPPAEPPVFAVIAGVLLLGFAYLLWVAPDYAVLGRRVAETAAIVNGLIAAVVVLWLVTGPVGVRLLGVGIALVVAAAKGVLAAAEARLASAP